MHTCKERKCTLKPARDCMPYAVIHSILPGADKWHPPPLQAAFPFSWGLPGSNAILHRDVGMAGATALFSPPSSCYAPLVLCSD